MRPPAAAVSALRGAEQAAVYVWVISIVYFKGISYINTYITKTYPYTSQQKGKLEKNVCLKVRITGTRICWNFLGGQVV